MGYQNLDEMRRSYLYGADKSLDEIYTIRDVAYHSWCVGMIWYQIGTNFPRNTWPRPCIANFLRLSRAQLGTCLASVLR
jgi:hypothetical protein